jgi:hypothetical protein
MDHQLPGDKDALPSQEKNQIIVFFNSGDISEKAGCAGRATGKNRFF